ncbi:hypothetical protein FisN_12Hh357 [Fistulifera solaris]|uniref:Uncharacterized protein n=1 Tax=Fistulifera solaris TaxID=1519565 RepID=A0A1Z5KBZ1_FISSO|nr:hypothetical protein FisN_12Hh357 [Fistulifera solaris]|eukprot:GAX23779.1 hypothetical protein FisN_12Hh357 [Fistulifera solaris]
MERQSPIKQYENSKMRRGSLLHVFFQLHLIFALVDFVNAKADAPRRTFQHRIHISRSSEATATRVSSRQSVSKSSLNILFSLPRGGSTATKDNLDAYYLQQQLYLQSRSLQLRQALIQRGILEFQHSESSQVAQNVDWDCALATAENPKSCLFSFDAEEGCKVIAPIDTQQWITLSALNRLRRNDPTKVEPLWHSQYNILQTWFHPNKSPYSLYTHLSPVGTFLSCLLDAPLLLGATIILACTFLFLATFPFWEWLIKRILTSHIMWINYHQWARFTRAALPLKLLLGQMAWKGLANVFGQIYGKIRTYLVEIECQQLEQAIPLTIVEGTSGGADADEEDDDDEFDGNDSDEDDAASDDDEDKDL